MVMVSPTLIWLVPAEHKVNVEIVDGISPTATYSKPLCRISGTARTKVQPSFSEVSTVQKVQKPQTLRKSLLPS
jgi:hypothetical protein